MPRFSAHEAAGIRAIQSELATIVAGAPFVLDTIAAPLRELLRTDMSCSYALTPRDENLQIEYFHTDGLRDSAGATRVFDAYLASRRIGWAAYNPVKPEREQRNRAMSTDDLGEPVRVAMRHPEFLPKMGLGGMDQLRVLICEGPSLLAWVGAFQHAQFEARQKMLLQRLVPSLKRRLGLERKMGRATLLDATLAHAFEAIGAPTFLITSAGRIVEMNAIAARLEAKDRTGIAATLVACATHPERNVEFTVSRITARGAPDHFLVVARADATTEVAHRLASAAKRWSLTDRQREVLALVAEGLTNRVIAATLGVAERTVEVHLTAIFLKVQVGSRAELVVKIWRG